MNFIDNFINRITMYRLVLYFLIVCIIWASILSFLGKFSFEPQALLYSTCILILVSFIFSKLFSKIFQVQTNSESIYITAFILALIISPPSSSEYLSILPLLFWAGAWSVSVKYIFAIGKRHIFNPVAFSVALTAVTIHGSASWWVGTVFMLSLVLIGGLLITHKIRRFDLVISFIVVATITIVYGSLNDSTNGLDLLRQIFVNSPIIFFATVMLTEPLTTPPTKNRRIIYGAITGILYAPFIHIGWLYSTPELALCVGNVASWLISPKFRYILTLKSKEKIARDTGEFKFISNRKINFKPGQYLEWTLAHKKTDNRGNRRFFTIASSPTEKEIILGVKFDGKRSSSFKRALSELDEGEKIVVGQLAGDFVLPKKKDKKLCFVAGGIGITPFRSMITYLLDKGEKRDVVLVYSCKRFDEIAYSNLFHYANVHFGMKTVYTLTDQNHIPENWDGERGFISVEMFIKEVPDYLDRTYFISGPPALIKTAEKILSELGVSKKDVITDYFPGF